MNVKITWVERGTNNAACLGFDDEFECPDCNPDLDEIRLAAEYNAECGGLDTEKYECVVEILETA